MQLPSHGYSSNVRLHLIVGEHSLEVEQVGGDSCLLADPFDHPPCSAELVMYVDDWRRSWKVTLPDGIVRDRPETKLA